MSRGLYGGAEVSVHRPTSQVGGGGGESNPTSVLETLKLLLPRMRCCGKCHNFQQNSRTSKPLLRSPNTPVLPTCEGTITPLEMSGSKGCPSNPTRRGILAALTSCTEFRNGLVPDRKRRPWASPRNGWTYIQKVNKVSVTVLDNCRNGGVELHTHDSIRQIPRRGDGGTGAGEARGRSPHRVARQDWVPSHHVPGANRAGNRQRTSDQRKPGACAPRALGCAYWPSCQRLEPPHRLNIPIGVLRGTRNQRRAIVLEATGVAVVMLSLDGINRRGQPVSGQ
jgi:hypothetical protein